MSTSDTAAFLPVDFSFTKRIFTSFSATSADTICLPAGFSTHSNEGSTQHPRFAIIAYALGIEANSLEKIRDLARRAVKAVGIKNGPAHVEIMLTPNGPKMIELGARMGGDCITTHLVPLSTGIDMIEATMRIACGQAPEIERKFNKGSAIRYFSVPNGEIKAIDGYDEAMKIPGVVEISFTKQVGEMACDIGSSVDRVGFVIAQGETADDAALICEKALKTVSITVK